MRRLLYIVTIAVLIAACFAVSGLNLAWAQSADTDLDVVLDNAVPGLSVQVNGTGGWYGQCMSAVFVNETGSTLRVRVPIGLRLVPVDEGVQTMVTAGDEVLEIPPGESTHPFTAFCSEMHDSAPSGHRDFSNGGYVDDDLMRVLRNIAAAGAQDSSAQGAVWSVTDNADISNDPVAQNFVPPAEVPPGRAAGAGLAAGLTGLGLAELTRRIGEGQGVKVPLPTRPEPPAEDSSELDDLLDTPDEDESTGDQPDEPPAEKPPADEPGDESEPPAEEPEKPADKPKPPPPPPKPPRAGDKDGGIKWNRDTHRVTIAEGGGYIEAGRGGGWVGVGDSPRPGRNPFELKPPDSVNVDAEGFSAHRRGDQIDASISTGDGSAPIDVFRDSATDTTRLQHGHFVLTQQGNRTSIQDHINGRATGVSYDGSSGDFSAFRNNFQLARTGDKISVTDKTPGGRDVGASYDRGSGDFSLQSGDRAAVRSGSAYGYQWGDRSLVYDPDKGFGAYEFPTNRGNGSLAVGAGSEGQFAVSRAQPLRIGNRDARLNIEYSRMLRDSGGGVETDFTAGLDVGRVSVEWSPGDRPSVRYNIKF